MLAPEFGRSFENRVTGSQYLLHDFVGKGKTLCCRLLLLDLSSSSSKGISRRLSPFWHMVSSACTDEGPELIEPPQGTVYLSA